MAQTTGTASPGMAPASSNPGGVIAIVVMVVALLVVIGGAAAVVVMLRTSVSPAAARPDPIMRMSSAPRL